jgi:hypothetical protein
MDFNFSKEILFVGGFIIILVLFIQYMMYSQIKKYIREEIAKTLVKTNKPQQTVILKNNNNIKDNIPHNEDKKVNNHDDETYDVETPEEDKNDEDNGDNGDNADNDDDSYVNPVHSEKNIDDDS